MRALSDEMLRSRISAQRAMVDAFVAYDPPPLNAAVHLFAASETLTLDPTLGWGSLLGPRLRVIPVDGNHRTILVRPNAGRLGDAISSGLREASRVRVPADR